MSDANVFCPRAQCAANVSMMNARTLMSRARRERERPRGGRGVRARGVPAGHHGPRGWMRLPAEPGKRPNGGRTPASPETKRATPGPRPAPERLCAARGKVAALQQDALLWRALRTVCVALTARGGGAAAVDQVRVAHQASARDATCMTAHPRAVIATHGAPNDARSQRRPPARRPPTRVRQGRGLREVPAIRAGGGADCGIV